MKSENRRVFWRYSYTHIDFLPNITQTSLTVSWFSSKLTVVHIFNNKSPKYPFFFETAKLLLILIRIPNSHTLQTKKETTQEQSWKKRKARERTKSQNNYKQHPTCGQTRTPSYAPNRTHQITKLEYQKTEMKHQRPHSNLSCCRPDPPFAKQSIRELLHLAVNLMETIFVDWRNCLMS